MQRQIIIVLLELFSSNSEILIHNSDDECGTYEGEIGDFIIKYTRSGPTLEIEHKTENTYYSKFTIESHNKIPLGTNADDMMTIDNDMDPMGSCDVFLNFVEVDTPRVTSSVKGYKFTLDEDVPQPPLIFFVRPDTDEIIEHTMFSTPYDLTTFTDPRLSNYAKLVDHPTNTDMATGFTVDKYCN